MHIYELLLLYIPLPYKTGFQFQPMATEYCMRRKDDEMDYHSRRIQSPLRC